MRPLKTSSFTFFSVSALYVRKTLLWLTVERIITGLSFDPTGLTKYKPCFNAVCMLSGFYRHGFVHYRPPFGLFCYIKKNILILFFILCASVLSRGQYYDIAQGCTGMILLLFCCIDFSAIKHYTESSSGDNLRSEPKPSSLSCGWLTACHSTAPCSVISMLSLDLCLTSGQSIHSLCHITVSSSSLMLSDGYGAGCRS